MRTLRNSLLAALFLAVGIGVVTATRTPVEEELKPLPADPSATPIEILHAQPFVLDEPYTHWWRAERPEVRSGMVLVLKTDRDLIRPRQTAEAVLYVGNEIAERVNRGDESGNLVVVVPSPANDDGEVPLNLRDTPIWFGSPELPERIGAAEIQAELEAALAEGVGPASFAKRMKTRRATATLFARDRDELQLTLADLIEFYSPTEVDLVAGMRVPLTR